MTVLGIALILRDNNGVRCYIGKLQDSGRVTGVHAQVRGYPDCSYIWRYQPLPYHRLLGVSLGFDSLRAFIVLIPFALGQPRYRTFRH
jgi:hypothetical protein